MSWEYIEERLARALSVKEWFPFGLLTLPVAPLDIDDWLVSAAQSDEELLELNIPRIQFLQNRWPIEQIARFEWEKPSFSFRALWSLRMHDRDCVLFSHGVTCYLIAGVQPQQEIQLYRIIMSRVLHNPSLIATPPVRVVSRLPCSELDTALKPRDTRVPVPAHAGHAYLADLMVGWVGPWINVPVVGYWHRDDSLPPA